jgi:hypothetical protein
MTGAPSPDDGAPHPTPPRAPELRFAGRKAERSTTLLDVVAARERGADARRGNS